MGIQIHELNALSRAPQTGDVLAIDTGTDTAKIDYNALATAIINKLGGDPVTIPHGGTGATTAAGARANLDVANDWEQMNNVTWNKTFVYNVALYQNHTVYVQMTIGSTGAVSGDILAVLPTNAKCRVFVPIVYADGASNALGGSGMAYIEGNSKNIIISKASVPANSYMNISMVIPVE